MNDTEATSYWEVASSSIGMLPSKNGFKSENDQDYWFG